MADAVPQVKLSGSIQGSTIEGALTTISWLHTLTNQDVHLQLSTCIEQGNVDKLIVLPSGLGPSGAGQTVFVLKPDKDVQIRLNGLSNMIWNISGGAPFIIAGTPEVTQVEFTSIISETAKVFITKIMDTTALPAPAGAPVPPSVGLYTHFETIGPATPAQTAFTLPTAPSNPANLVVIVDGVWYSVLNNFASVAGTALTWNPAAPGSFAFVGGERVEVIY